MAVRARIRLVSFYVVHGHEAAKDVGEGGQPGGLGNGGGDHVARAVGEDVCVDGVEGADGGEGGRGVGEGGEGVVGVQEGGDGGVGEGEGEVCESVDEGCAGHREEVRE